MMKPQQAWGVFSVLFALALLAGASALVTLGYSPYPVAIFSVTVLLLFFYIVYKRYNVEVIPESDIMLFDSKDDLRILCRIYGLDDRGRKRQLRQRLLEFSRAHREKAFIWVTPRTVSSIASALELPSPEPETSPKEEIPEIFFKVISDVPSEESMRSRLVWGRRRSGSRLAGISACAVCDSEVSGKEAVCQACGADLEFYSVLSESKIGRRMVSAKAVARKRKLRYPLSPLGGS